LDTNQKNIDKSVEIFFNYLRKKVDKRGGTQKGLIGNPVNPGTVPPLYPGTKSSFGHCFD